ncbi:MAG TPA: hypothetical protein VEA41_07145 [Salinarimonas sp.]|nr:hypothetical protein [Salinarimonas sp.]
MTAAPPADHRIAPALRTLTLDGYARPRPSLVEALAQAEAIFEARKLPPVLVDPYAAARAWHEAERRRRALAWRSAVLYAISIGATVLQFGTSPA